MKVPKIPPGRNSPLTWDGFFSEFESPSHSRAFAVDFVGLVHKCHLFYHSALCISLNGDKDLMLFLLLLVNLISALCISETVGGHCQQYRSVYVSTPRITPAPIFQDVFHQNLPRRGESLAARPLEWGQWSSMESSRRAGRGSSLECLE